MTVTLHGIMHVIPRDSEANWSQGDQSGVVAIQCFPAQFGDELLKLP
jgi:hypothetical protein